MKKLASSLVTFFLALCSRIILRKYRPCIVMITGSVGKTSTKDAVAAALSAKFLVRASEKSYNSEFGVPLTIIGAKNPWNNPSAWLGVFGEALALIVFPNHYPKLLVLEVGADHPGDLARILRIATPDVVVVTSLPSVPVHVEAYATPEAVRAEEFLPAYALSHGAPLIISADDPFATELAKPLEASITSFGESKQAQIRLTAIAPLIENGVVRGMTAEIQVGAETYPLIVSGALGRTQLYAPAAALATALALGMTALEALEGIASYAPPPGRARILRGRSGSTIIDDSYNASPSATREALNGLSFVSGSRRIAVLADMLELGRYSAGEHERIGSLAADQVDLLITVGARARAMADAARSAGMKDSGIFSFETSHEAIEPLQAMLQTGDLVLIKGSQSMRMERLVEALLLDPTDRKLLVRQDKEWLKR